MGQNVLWHVEDLRPAIYKAFLFHIKFKRHFLQPLINDAQSILSPHLYLALEAWAQLLWFHKSYLQRKRIILHVHLFTLGQATNLPFTRKTPSWSMHVALSSSLVLSFLVRATTYLAKALGSASQLLKRKIARIFKFCYNCNSNSMCTRRHRSAAWFQAYLTPRTHTLHIYKSEIDLILRQCQCEEANWLKHKYSK